jgi:hypothetical protein
MPTGPYNAFLNLVYKKLASTEVVYGIAPIRDDLPVFLGDVGNEFTLPSTDLLKCLVRDE